MSTNHVIDPTFFLDAIELFAFDYTWYVKQKPTVDDLGRLVNNFTNQIIHGSLQPKEATLNQTSNGNTTSKKYNFYCSSLYRINNGDFIVKEDGEYLIVDGTQNYDEYGVRECTLTMVNLNEYRDLEEYIKYLNGDITI